MAFAGDELNLAQPVIDGRFYWLALRRPDALRSSHLASTSICYCIDDALLYEPFFADFGPLNLGKVARFCRQTQELLQEGERSKKRVYYYCGPHVHQKANAAVLVGIFQVIYLNRSAEEAYKPIMPFKPFVPFRDASCGVSTFHLTVFDVVKGVQKARDVGFIDWNSGNSTWSLEEYEHYEQVENGDLNWIVPGKLVAFSGPAARGNEIAGYRLHTPEDYWDYYRKKGVSAVVRLNKKVYDRKRFTDGGFRHYDLYFPDGSCPTEPILLKFLEIAESEPGALAIHCKAGLGRTGVLICCYIMKHFKFTAEEVIGYIRVCRPGSVIGPQQNFLRDVEARMWQEGDMWRAARNINKPHLALGDLVVNGRSAAHAGHGPDHGPVAGVSGDGYGPAASSVPITNGSRAGSAAAPAGAYGMNGSYVNGMSSAAPMAGAAGAALRQPRTSSSNTDLSAAAASAERSGSAADMSLVQYAQLQHGGGGSGSLNSRNGSTAFASLAVQVPSPSVASSTSNSTATTPTAASGRGGSAAFGSAGGVSRGYGGGSIARSITPLRYAASATPAHGYGGVVASHPPALGGGASIIAGPMGGGLSARAGAAPSVSRSMPVMAYGAGPGGRAPSADRAAERASALRATLHTDTLRAADRPRPPIPERNAQSAEVGLSGSGPGWRIGANGAGSGVGGVVGTGAAASSPIPTTPKAPAPGHRPGAGVARTLAPNGQPRKVPIAMLPQYHAGMAGRPASIVSGGGGLTSGGAAVPTAGNGSLLGPGQQDYGRLKSVAQLRYGLHSK